MRRLSPTWRPGFLKSDPCCALSRPGGGWASGWVSCKGTRQNSLHEAGKLRCARPGARQGACALSCHQRVAVNAHGYLRFTRDVDLVIQLDPDNVIAAFRAMEGIGYRDKGRTV